ncbi:type III pantothenate kinase [Gayadomonas joobiniege]|uniref:type III pantothenate kinase n=1 Tax=Gayadomonas joobiniege TaxID=1234606 RepID=UPI00035FFE14|nr:type III pantothenate kinase [Gayadomonas joobiniege]
MTVLFADIGNTRVKFSILKNEEITWVSAETVMAWPADSVNEIWLADVSESQPALIACLCQKHPSAKIFKVDNTQAKINFKHTYARPEKLGVDRFLAMLAAPSEQGALVVDAGTALTIDAVYQKQHLGGYIVPGLTLSRRALAGQKSVLLSDQNSDAIEFGRTTETCISHGTLMAQLSLIQTSFAHLQQKYPQAELIIAGGDGSLLHQHLLALGLKNKFISDLVFNGLRIYRKSLIK